MQRSPSARQKQTRTSVVGTRNGLTKRTRTRPTTMTKPGSISTLRLAPMGRFTHLAAREILGGASGREIEATGLAQLQGGKQEPTKQCAKFIFGGNHDRTLQMAFGDQTVCTDRGADNSHLHRCPEIERWAMDVYDWCVLRYGRENIIGFQVHLDETSPVILS